MAKKPKKDAGAEGEAPEGEGGGKKGLLANKKLLIIAGAGLVLVLGGGGGAAFFLMGGEDPAAEAAAAIETAEPSAYYYDLPVMILNLSSTENHAAYVKLQVALEVADEHMLTLIEPNMPRVLDAFQTYMRELRVSDLQGSAGLYRLKEELQRRVNIAVYPARVDDVLFKNVIVQ
jgi:flagellar FliL protein